MKTGKIKSVYMREELVDAIQRHAKSMDRTFSWAAAKLLESHPVIKKLLRKDRK